jgi:hypothetical protein
VSVNAKLAVFIGFLAFLYGACAYLNAREGWR